MIILTARTRKGKNVILNHGVAWELEETSDTVHFSGRKGKDIWLLIRSVITTDVRWVHKIDDDNFIITEIK